MTASIRHIGLVVKDMKSSLEFWLEAMNFKLISKQNESGKHIDLIMGLNKVKVTTAKLADQNNNRLELLNFQSHPDESNWDGAPYSTGLTHIALTVTDLDYYLNRLEKFKDHEFKTYPQFSPDGHVRFIYAKGPEGLILELVEEKRN